MNPLHLAFRETVLFAPDLDAYGCCFVVVDWVDFDSFQLAFVDFESTVTRSEMIHMGFDLTLTGLSARIRTDQDCLKHS